MNSSPGRPDRIGSYPIEREIGRGGMGIVYLGRDTRLGRPVAIKVLPEEFSRDPERLARFEREARMVASLSHSNIAGIYGIEETDGRKFLALEYVEGETLAERIARGPLPWDETLEIGRQIAAGLEAAHENGVVHRDLKPGNIKLTPSGDVKILDFGLAKSGVGNEAASGSNLSHSPTMTHAATVAGVILGTAAYMSPEQARGRVVDRRTDIWSFGCVLYECLTGRQAFAGETVSDMIARILQGRPEWDDLPAGTPAGVRRLLERCLEKDAKKRLRDIGDVRLEIEDMLSGKLPAMPDVAGPQVRVSRSARLAWLAALFFAAVAAGLAAYHWLSAPAVAPVVRLSLTAPGGVNIFENTVGTAVSPDGSLIAFVASDSAGDNHVWVRPIASSSARLIPGTEGVFVLFWSPDSRRIAFFTGERLKQVDLEGGTPENICNVKGGGRGGDWNADGTIVLAPAGEGPLFKVSANGGVPEQVTFLDSTRHEIGHRFPHFLPDGRHFLFAALPSHEGLFDIFVGSTTSSDREPLMKAAGVPVYVEPGYLLYDRNGRLVAHRFDARKRRLVGEPVSIGDEPGPSDWLGAPSVRASRQDVIVYYRQNVIPTELAWFDRTGRRTGTVPVPPGLYDWLSLSPDEERAVVNRRVSATESDLWIVELARGTMTRFTFGPGRCDQPVWSPDGSRIVFSSDRSGTWDVYVKPVGGASEEKLPTSRATLTYPVAWSPDGRTLLFKQLSEKTDWDLWTISVDGSDREQVPYMNTPFGEFSGWFSPDGRWICYESDESGLSEIYAQAFPTPGLKHKISNGGGTSPVWRRDGREISYIDLAGRPTFVTVDSDNGFSTGPPVPAFSIRGVRGGSATGDFQRVLLSVVDERHHTPGEISVLLNWQGEIGKR
jgi:Tol biopolymer transport system component/predicted Ser/Thr protein kinase